MLIKKYPDKNMVIVCKGKRGYSDYSETIYRKVGTLLVVNGETDYISSAGQVVLPYEDTKFAIQALESEPC